MSGELLSSFTRQAPNQRRSLRSWALLAGATALVTVFLLSGAAASGVSGRGSPAIPGSPPASAVASVPPPIVLTPITANNSSVDVSVALNLTVNATGGSNNGSNYNYTWNGLPTGCVNTFTNPENCTPTAPGSFSVTVTVMDTSTTQQATSNPLVIKVNALPVLTAFTVNGGSTAKVAVNATLWFNSTPSLGTSPYTYKFTGLPIGCTGNTSTFSCTPTRAGIYNVTVSEIDVFGLASAVLNVTVKVTAPTVTTASTGIGTTGWAVVIGIVVVGGLATAALLIQARREERAGRMGAEDTAQKPPESSGGTPPPGGSMPPGPPS